MDCRAQLGDVATVQDTNRRSLGERLRPRRRSRGQSLVEFALVLPVLLLTIVIALDFGRAFFAWVGVTNASRAGAAYAASNPKAGWAGTPNAAIAAVYRSQITTDLLPTNCTLPSPIPLPSLSGTNLGDSVTVTLTCTFNTITPLISNIIGSNIPITATTVYPVRAGEIANGPVLNQVPVPTPEPTPTPTPVPTPVPTPTPTPGPGPTPTPEPTPTPTPAPCTVPQMTGLTVAAARTAWLSAGFTGAFNVQPPGAKDSWFVTSQIPAGASTPIDCATAADITAKKNQ